MTEEAPSWSVPSEDTYSSRCGQRRELDRAAGAGPLLRISATCAACQGAGRNLEAWGAQLPWGAVGARCPGRAGEKNKLSRL
ncbi:hypothetical protein AB1E18_016254 [Capra hircus]